MKKGQGISINVIIVAALALLVLVILALIFAGKIGKFRTQSEDCRANGGFCASSCGSNARQMNQYTGCGTDSCCIGFQKKDASAPSTTKPGDTPS